MTFTSRSALAALLVVASAGAADAQTAGSPDTPPLLAVNVGDYVRVRLAPDAASGADVRCEGFVAGDSAGTVLLRAKPGCPQGDFAASSVHGIDVVRGTGSSRLGHTLLGATLGAVAGGIGGGVTAGPTCKEVPCRNRDSNRGRAIALSAVRGGVAGALVGFVLPSGPRWRSVALVPIRIAATALGARAQVAAAR